MDTTFKTPKGIFNYRAGALILNDTKILMRHAKHHKEQCHTIGGRAKLGETSEQAVLREIFEETGVKAELDRLAVIHESLFYMEGIPHHELAFYWLVQPFDYEKIDYSAIKRDDDDLEIFWLDLTDKEEREKTEIFPPWLSEKVLKLPKGIKHIVTAEKNFKPI